MEYRNSPLKFLDHSPSQLLNGRNIKTLVPCSKKSLEPQNVDHDAVKKRLQYRKDQQVKYYNQNAHPLPKLFQGETVMLQTGKIWIPAKIMRCLENNDFLVKIENGTIYRRNEDF